jgi:hypothetical protein
MDDILDEVVLTCMEDAVDEEMTLDNPTNPDDFSELQEEDEHLEYEQENRYNI